MTVTIYNYTDDINRLDKNNYISQIGTYTGTVRDEYNVENPEILIDGNVTIGNYCMIDSPHGFYWIIGKTVERNNLTRIETKRDAAMTFLQGLKNSPCICFRNTSQYNSDFPDSKYPTLQQKYIETYAMQSLPNDDAIVFAFVE